jgi:hypothetical protein
VYLEIHVIKALPQAKLFRSLDSPPERVLLDCVIVLDLIPRHHNVRAAYQ